MSTLDCVFFLIVIICLAAIQSHVKLNSLRRRMEELESHVGAQSSILRAER